MFTKKSNKRASRLCECGRSVGVVSHNAAKGNGKDKSEQHKSSDATCRTRNIHFVESKTGGSISSEHQIYYVNNVKSYDKLNLTDLTDTPALPLKFSSRTIGHSSHSS